MKLRHITSVIFAVLLVIGSSAVLACKAAGPNKHVGEVTTVDAEAATFTIMDAETNLPITFSASKGILKDVSHAEGQIMVSYEDNGGNLTAVDVHF